MKKLFFAAILTLAGFARWFNIERKVKVPHGTEPEDLLTSNRECLYSNEVDFILKRTAERINFLDEYPEGPNYKDLYTKVKNTLDKLAVPNNSPKVYMTGQQNKKHQTLVFLAKELSSPV